MSARILFLLAVAAIFFGTPVVVATSSADGKVTLSVAVSGKGKVTSSPAGLSCPGTCRARFAANKRVRLTAHPASGWAFSGWRGACGGRGACSVRLNVGKAVRAVFAKLPPPPPPPGSSRDFPVPIGTPAAISTQDAPSGWMLTVNSVTPDASDQVVAADPDNLPPAPDQQYFMVSITATYNGSVLADAGQVPDGLDVIGATNISYLPAAQDGCGTLPSPDFVLSTTDVTVAAGGSITGNVCWPVSTDDASSLEMVNDQAAPVWFALH